MTGDYTHLRWWCEASERAAAELAALFAEVERQRAANVALAERLAAASECLSRAAERGRVCGCQTRGVSA